MILSGRHLVHGVLAGPSRQPRYLSRSCWISCKKFRERVGTSNTLQAGCGISVSVGLWEETVSDTTSRHMEVSQGGHQLETCGGSSLSDLGPPEGLTGAP